MPDTNALTRKELYDLVWSEPRSVLSKKLGVSDVWIAKSCRKAGIPVPVRGYWAKKDAGKKVFQPDLPLRFPGATDSIEFGRYGPENRSTREYLLNNPLPPAPTFDESIPEVTTRVKKIVGKVSYAIFVNLHFYQIR